jgi:hypothetical protein
MFSCDHVRLASHRELCAAIEEVLAAGADATDRAVRMVRTRRAATTIATSASHQSKCRFAADSFFLTIEDSSACFIAFLSKLYEALVLVSLMVLPGWLA